MFPRTGSRALVLVGLFFIFAIAMAGAFGQTDAPRLEASPPPGTRLDEPSAGRLLRDAEVREQLGPDWREAHLSLVRFAAVADLAPDTGTVVAPDRLVWLVVRRTGDDWAIRVYDAATGARLATLAGAGTAPR